MKNTYLESIDTLLNSYKEDLATLQSRWEKLLHAEGKDVATLRSQTYGKIRAYHKIIKDLEQIKEAQ